MVSFLDIFNAINTAKLLTEPLSNCHCCLFTTPTFSNSSERRAQHEVVYKTRLGDVFGRVRSLSLLGAANLPSTCWNSLGLTECSSSHTIVLFDVIVRVSGTSTKWINNNINVSIVEQSQKNHCAWCTTVLWSHKFCKTQVNDATQVTSKVK